MSYFIKNLAYVSVGGMLLNGLTAETAQAASSRPIWAIAHRVLEKKAVDAALNHGANALEIDMTAENGGPWWAQHDAGALGRGDKAADLFTYIGQQRSAGKNVSFVWLDMKTPNGCGTHIPSYNQCKVQALAEDARKLLEDKGIYVMYGFPQLSGVQPNKSGLRYMAQHLTDKEAISVSAGSGIKPYGEFDNAFNVLKTVEQIPPDQRVIDSGFFNPGLAKKQQILDGLKKGAGYRAENNLARVFGWTAVYSSQVSEMLDTGADGVIYGNASRQYTGDKSNEELMKKFHDRIASSGGSLRLATTADAPFGKGKQPASPGLYLKATYSRQCLSRSTFNMPAMEDCSAATPWKELPNSNGTFKLQNLATGLCLTEVMGRLAANPKCGGNEEKYQQWSRQGDMLKNRSYFLNGASLTKDPNSQQAHDVHWEEIKVG
ncbi:hypothetical protein [Streptomyces alanosinicus]|nr:hypothetical protein [Streptomyces alanosinicus]